jgi:hypothetical protein
MAFLCSAEARPGRSAAGPGRRLKIGGHRASFPVGYAARGDDVLNLDGTDCSVRPVMMGSEIDDATPTAAL